MRPVTIIIYVSCFVLGHAGKQCEIGWKEFGCYCYRYLESKVTWDQAKRECRDYEAELASIHTQLENDFINEMLPAQAESWIGLHDSIAESRWMWIDDTKTDYINWASGQPNSKNTEQDCVEFWSVENTWNDESCSVSNPFVCKKSADIQHAVNKMAAFPMSNQAILVFGTGGECIEHLQIQDLITSKTWTQKRSDDQSSHAFYVKPLSPCTTYNLSVTAIYKADPNRTTAPVNQSITTTFLELPKVPAYNVSLSNNTAIITWRYKEEACISAYTVFYQWMDPLCRRTTACLGPIKEVKVEVDKSSMIVFPVSACRTYTVNFGYYSDYNHKIFSSNTTTFKSKCTDKEIPKVPAISVKQASNNAVITWESRQQSIKNYIILYQEIQPNQMGAFYSDRIKQSGRRYLTKPLSPCSTYFFNFGLVTNQGDVKFLEKPTALSTTCASPEPKRLETSSGTQRLEYKWMFLCVSLLTIYCC